MGTFAARNQDAWHLEMCRALYTQNICVHAGLGIS